MKLSNREYRILELWGLSIGRMHYLKTPSSILITWTDV